MAGGDSRQKRDKRRSYEHSYPNYRQRNATQNLWRNSRNKRRYDFFVLKAIRDEDKAENKNAGDAIRHASIIHL